MIATRCGYSGDESRSAKVIRHPSCTGSSEGNHSHGLNIDRGEPQVLRHPSCAGSSEGNHSHGSSIDDGKCSPDCRINETNGNIVDLQSNGNHRVPTPSAGCAADSNFDVLIDELWSEHVEKLGPRAAGRNKGGMYYHQWLAKVDLLVADTEEDVQLDSDEIIESDAGSPPVTEDDRRGGSDEQDEQRPSDPPKSKLQAGSSRSGSASDGEWRFDTATVRKDSEPSPRAVC